MVQNQIDIGFLTLSSVSDGVSIHPKGKPDQLVKPVIFYRNGSINSVLVNTVYDETGVAHYLEFTTVLHAGGPMGAMTSSVPGVRKHNFLFSRSEMSDQEISMMLAKAHSIISFAFQSSNSGFAGAWNQPQFGQNQNQSNW